MTHDELVDALRGIDALKDVGSADNPNFHFRSRPFLHFHADDDGTYADVMFGGSDFEPVAATSPAQRAELLARVVKHVRRIERSRKSRR